MVIQKIKELEELKARAAKLAASIDAERTAELAALPGKYGYDDVNAFIKALKQAAGVRKSRKGSKAPKAAKSEGGKRTRAKITPELKEQVKAAVAEGKTGSEIAAAFGISLPSVQNIKKEFGLVKAREASAPAETPAAS
ncbi:helix-turn-helix domain-containing protein [Opitutaceae bacterium TAV4]|uniref:hypothetical protein n=1 Tax=Geminisphaera colitermitum TaxID=1148786 RepID=UPI0005B9B4D0|nr:hypothetical protein [Geminisphaera colitermitum]RRK01308.1 helix-turn-helix domain-containing protein [Opitutaceae bacterium TAV4]RRK01660.1 helix-turn-helix domain-containing protein [Opitutaceae bacterium TAV3]